MKLKYQLFVVLLVASALLIALMLVVNSVSFQRQFINYVNTVEHNRLQPFIKELAEIHDKSGDWEWVNKASWEELLRKHSVERRAGHLSPSKRDANPSPRNRSTAQNRQPDPGRKGRKPLPWLTLIDAEHNLVLGIQHKHERLQWLPITSGEGIAGYLGLTRHRQLSRLADKKFARQQRRNFLYAALAMTLLSALIAAPLAARLIKPLKAVNNSISALSGGNYEYRTSTKRSDEFGDLAININRLGETLEQNIAARQRWIAEISHELRTPVAVLQSELNTQTGRNNDIEKYYNSRSTHPGTVADNRAGCKPEPRGHGWRRRYFS